ncbi:GDP-L-fucose synthase [Streptomyces coeruleorubidus]|uniref:GDP-L-fucose synthase family protein n=1 Tax=Streptomyces coeruleorubidus TaxID=116188 RepID=UPI00237F7E7C|nr:GDP-L-fucose synthase [Streptomyces coeruleorubidus]WDV54249.1 GDP-L-fucose synthase [Streptomyces coeruleorubidus]
MAACTDTGAPAPVASAVNAPAAVRDDRVHRPLDRSARVFVAGGSGLVGSAVRRELRREGFTDVVAPGSAELDLRERQAVFDWFAAVRPDVVVLAAARVGGIKANTTRPAEFLSDNLRIQVNMLDAALEHGVERLLFLGSSCIYPKFAEQPIREEALLTGPLEPTNDAYAIAKIAGILNVRAVRRQYGLPWISAMPTNLYGPGDNFHPEHSHVLPSLMRRFHEAKESGARRVVNWGSGAPRREFLHVDDLARACLHLIEHYDGDSPVNVGTGTDLTIRELAELVADVVGYRGSVEWDTKQPDGTPRKLLDVSRLIALGWAPRIGLREGIARTYAWYVDNLESGTLRH